MRRLRVTEVLAISGLIDTQWYTEYACDRGTAVHSATALHDAGQLDESSDWGDEVAHGRLEGWKRFVSECSVKILRSEFEVTHPTLNYVGHADRLITLDERPWVIDIKPATPERWHGLQLAAYQRAIQDSDILTEGGLVRRANVYLDKGKYKWIPRCEPRDWNVFHAALIVAQWKEASQ